MVKETTTEVKKIEPTVKPYEYDSGFIPRKGHYHLVEVDAYGKEKKGSDFDIAEATYIRVYKPLTMLPDDKYEAQKFMLKKSPSL